ncbi:MAG: NADH-quinone oxidoreductase subunit [Thermoproteota archaeon]|nr:NADH-quinone oxidoreductase subunit [Thermoproteota archaeon]
MIAVQVILEFLTTIFIFPGFLFTLVASLLNQWYVRKVVAKMQNRVGPRFAGPFGILQPFYDFYKLMRKEEITPNYGNARLFGLFMGIGIGSNIAILMFFPISPFRFHGPFDIVVFAYLGLWTTIAIALASLIFPNIFSSIGVSRLISLMLVYEPTWILSVLTPSAIVSKYSSIPFSILETITNFSVILSNPLYLVLTAISFITAVASLQCRLGLQPFDIFEADTEIIAGAFTEFSGNKMALSTLLHDIETFTGATLLVFIFLGGPFPFFLNTAEGVLLIILKFLAVIFLLTVIRASSARYRLDQAIGFFKYPLLLALAALIVASIV